MKNYLKEYRMLDNDNLKNIVKTFSKMKPEFSFWPMFWANMVLAERQDYK